MDSLIKAVFFAFGLTPIASNPSISCGEFKTGVYVRNGNSLSFDIELPTYGGIKFDASKNDFDISSISMGKDIIKTDGSSLEVNNLKAGNYTFTIISDNTLLNRLSAIPFHQESTETFGGTTEYDIGWQKVMFCDEGNKVDSARMQYIYNSSEYMETVAPLAIAVKVVPNNGTDADNDDFAVYTKVCSNPVIAANNLLELSYTIDTDTLTWEGYADTDNWYGTSTALARLENSCTQGLKNIQRSFYHACNNGGGIHIQGTLCRWGGVGIREGETISIYFGFDGNREFICDGKGDGGFTSLINGIYNISVTCSSDSLAPS